ncbi:hypothetical protein [Leifsonia xyli]|uniref:hypothetical protein n=1 Tax=Leifsonia xyli TaxID=1575 RepID=UPI000AE3AE92
MKQRFVMVVAVAGSAGVLGALLTGFAAKSTDETKAADAVAAVQHVAPATLSNLAATTSNSTEAAKANLDDGSVVLVSENASSGVKLETPGTGSDVTIGLPFAGKASKAVRSQKAGVVVYNNKNGSSTVPVVHKDGRVQISTVIDNAKAPKRYDYPIEVPSGASLVQSPQGVIAIVAGDGAPLRVFGNAWAKDAHGKAVPTHYEIVGNTLTQVIDFTEHTAFPVVADPSTSAYSYNCVLTNGSSYFLKPGTPLTMCKGSRLQMYYNGRVAYTYYLKLNGQPGNPKRASLDCIIAIAGAAAGLVSTTSGIAVWATLSSIYGIKACIA